MARWESREVGSPPRLMTRTTRLDFQAEGTTAKRKTRLEKESRRWRHHGKETLKSELGRQSARQVGIADFSLSFCAQGFQRKRCQLCFC